MPRARRVPFVQFTQLYIQNGGLEAVHAVIVSDLVVVVALALPVIAQRARALRESRIIRHQSSALAVCAEVFASSKTEAGNDAETDPAAFIESAMRLSGVFDHGKVMLAGDM